MEMYGRKNDDTTETYGGGGTERTRGKGDASLGWENSNLGRRLIELVAGAELGFVLAQIWIRLRDPRMLGYSQCSFIIYKTRIQLGPTQFELVLRPLTRGEHLVDTVGTRKYFIYLDNYYIWIVRKLSK